jgi:membrane protease YdiL (CAAX protease family)
MVPDSPVAISDAASTAQPRALGDEKRQRWFELSLVLFVAFGTFFLNSLYLFRNGPSAAPHISGYRWLMATLQEVTSLLLLGYVLWRRNLRLRDLGLRWSLRDVGIGLIVAFAAFLATSLGTFIIQMAHYAAYGSFSTGPTGKDFFSHPGVMAIPFSLLNPFFEELIVRAYLMTEIMDLTGSSALAVALSVAVQCSYHLYYGWVGVISVSFSFLFFALYYASSRKALPIIVAHGFFDIYAVIRLW